MVKPIDAWRRQKNSAIKRGIGWYFTFQEWCEWWGHHLGPDWFGLRGCKEGQYVMARNGDTGPYSPENIRCDTVGGNHREFNDNHPQSCKKQKPRPKPDIVVAVFKAAGRYVDIAQQYGIDPHQVHCIKTKKYYRKLTDTLDAN